jgi:hypothetical protein
LCLRCIFGFGGKMAEHIVESTFELELGQLID